MKKRILGILLCLIMAVGMIPTMAMAQENEPPFNLETDLKGIQIPENLVTCICTTTNESKTYGRLLGGFTKYGKVTKKNDIWTVTVRIENSVYLKNFDTDTKENHFPDPKHLTDFAPPVQFELKHNGEKWELMDQIPIGKELHFTCDGKHKPSVPMFSNITGISEKLVAVSCTNVSGGSSGKFYGLIDGAFTATEPILNSDGVYESTITLNAKKYLERFNADTGILHSLVSEKDTEGKPIDPVFVVKYDHDKKMWVPKEETKNLIIFVKCEKHEAQPQPPEMPMYPTIDNISGLDKVNVGVLCIQAPAQSKIYGLIDGGFTATEPALKDGVYESMVTIIPSAYCNQYNSDTGITHELRPLLDVDEQPILRSFVVKYDEAIKKWMLASKKVELGIWVNCGKHETSTSVTPVYPPSGGGSTIKPGSNGSNQGDGAVVNPDNNQGDNKDKVDTGNKQTGKTKKSDTMEKVPKTGDNTGMTIWLVLLLLSVGALFGTVAFDRKRKRI